MDGHQPHAVATFLEDRRFHGLAALGLLSQLVNKSAKRNAPFRLIAARQFCDDVLAKFGVEVAYYDGVIGAGIAPLIKPNTAVVYLESPGSLTFEVQDVPAIARVAKQHGATVLMDNTWASPLFSRAARKGG